MTIVVLEQLPLVGIRPLERNHDQPGQPPVLDVRAILVDVAVDIVPGQLGVVADLVEDGMGEAVQLLLVEAGQMEGERDWQAKVRPRNVGAHQGLVVFKVVVVQSALFLWERNMWIYLFR